MDELLEEFLAEAGENLEIIDRGMVELEQNPDNAELLDGIFRAVHTIKGTCGFIGLPRLEKVAHGAENMLSMFREGELKPTPERVTLVLAAIDRIKIIVKGLETTEKEPEGDDSALIAQLDAACAGEELPVAELEEPAAKAEEQAAAEDENANDTDEDEEILIGDGRGLKGSDGLVAPVAARSLRVNLTVLENLMTVVSELVLTRNQLAQLARAHPDSEFVMPLQRLGQIVSEVQETVMQTRMQPVGNAWSPLPRLVRDASVELGKKVALEMRGQDTELDREILEMIRDPLTHMVRNSVDHGMETPEERVAAGKPEEGRILLNAFHEGGHIIIEISDDGRGLSPDKIGKKAVENGLVSENDLAKLDDYRICQFIFMPGFSTAEAVTAYSGRGVGMDVVRANIEKIGGTVDLKSVEGKGSTFSIKIPLTLAIIPGLIVGAAGQRFAVPQIGVQELVRTGGSGSYKVEEIRGAKFMRLREKLLPLVALRDLLQLEEKEKKEPQGERDRPGRFVLVLRIGADSFGLIVDQVFDTEEIVVKPVSSTLRHIDFYAGNTILGDGSIIMILDPNGIARSIGEMALSRAEAESREEEKRETEAARETSLLIFKAGDGGPKAVPLNLIARLEEIDENRIEMSGGQQMVQYNDALMPLVPYAQLSEVGAGKKRPILVFTDRHRSMGLMVDRVVDIISEHLDIQFTKETEGLLGSAIVKGKAMDVVDIGHYLELAYGDWFGDGEFEPSFEAQEKGAGRILLVDDSPFFRNMLTPVLRAAGYELVVAENATAALVLMSKGEMFDLIISDIEMPGLSGFDFAERVRADDSIWKDVPLLALTSHTTEEDKKRGQAVGFNAYIAKFDKTALLGAVSRTLGIEGDTA